MLSTGFLIVDCGSWFKINDHPPREKIFLCKKTSRILSFPSHAFYNFCFCGIICQSPKTNSETPENKPRAAYRKAISQRTKFKKRWLAVSFREGSTCIYLIILLFLNKTCSFFVTILEERCFFRLKILPKK